MTVAKETNECCQTWEATIVQADKYMQSNSFKEDSRMIEQNFKVSFETYEQLGWMNTR